MKNSNKITTFAICIGCSAFHDSHTYRVEQALAIICICEIDWNHEKLCNSTSCFCIWNVFDDMKNLSDERLKVYKSIFRKFSTLLLCLETTLMGELKSQEFIFKSLKFVKIDNLGSLHRFCQKCKLWPLSLKLHIWCIWSIRNSVLTMKICLDQVFRVYKSIFEK